MSEYGYTSPFPENLRKLLSQGRIQSDLAEHIGCTRQAISKYANGQSQPNLGVLVGIADYFNVTLDWLCGRTEEKRAATIGEICSLLGLNEDVVLQLLISNAHDRDFAAGVDMLLSSKAIYPAVYALRRASERNQEINDRKEGIWAEALDNKDDPEAKLRANAAIMALEEPQKAALYTVEHALSELVADLLPMKRVQIKGGKRNGKSTGKTK